MNHWALLDPPKILSEFHLYGAHKIKQHQPQLRFFRALLGEWTVPERVDRVSAWILWFLHVLPGFRRAKYRQIWGKFT